MECAGDWGILPTDAGRRARVAQDADHCGSEADRRLDVNRAHLAVLPQLQIRGLRIPAGWSHQPKIENDVDRRMVSHHPDISAGSAADRVSGRLTCRDRPPHIADGRKPKRGKPEEVQRKELLGCRKVTSVSGADPVLSTAHWHRREPPERAGSLLRLTGGSVLCHGGVIRRGPCRAGSGASQQRGVPAPLGDCDVTAVPVGRSPTDGKEGRPVLGRPLRRPGQVTRHLVHTFVGDERDCAPA